tara:strand:- start:290 stop:952 length:663 start_codon:yes stop_codon:yes gene_type:complete
MKTFIQIREELDNINKADISEAAIHTHADGTTVHHSDEDRGEVYSIKHGGKTHTVNTHAYTVPGETVAGNVKKHIAAQAPGIPSHAKNAIAKHMAESTIHKDELSESTIQESVRALPKGYVNHETIKDNIKNYGDGVKLGHGAHEIEHPEEPGGSGRATYKTPSHPHAYAHHDKKTGKVTAVEIKHKKTSAAAVAKAMGHKEVGPHHHAIADTHNDENLV